MQGKKLNVKKVAITTIIVVLTIIFIAVLTKYLTNKKEAVYVSTNTSDASLNVAASDKQENVWEINTISNSNTAVKNEVTTQNTEATTNNETNQTTNTETANTATTNTETANTATTNTATTNTATTNTTENATTSNTTTDSATKKDPKDVKGVIWLTFDDGPSSTITPKILDILKKENVKATFFILNYSKENEKIVKRIAEEGHTIGVHGYSHEYSDIYKSKKAFWNNVYKLQDKIEKSTGIKTMYTRFPGGSSNTISKKYSKGIMKELTKEMLAKGFKYFDWNISSGDAGGAKTAKAIAKNVTKRLSKKSGNLVLCHDSGGHKATLEALPDIIAYGKKKGYVFKAIDDNTPMYAHPVNN